MFTLGLTRLNPNIPHSIFILKINLCHDRKEVQARVRHLSGSSSVDGGGGAVQFGPYHPYHPRAFGLRFHGRQRGYLRHLPQEPRRRASVLHQLEQAHRADRLFHHWLITWYFVGPETVQRNGNARLSNRVKNQIMLISRSGLVHFGHLT